MRPETKPPHSARSLHVSDLVTTRAIVIRHTPQTETSRIIHWVTEDHGKLTTLAKGALRPRNSML